MRRFLFVQGHAFFHTIPRGIGFRTVSPVLDRNQKTIHRKLTAAIKLYQCRGLTVCDVHGDSKFECVREQRRPIELSIVPADSHVGEVERSIQIIQERLRSCVHGLPFRRIPKLLVTSMVADAVRCLNQFPRKNGISDTLSLAATVTGASNPDFNSMRIGFGSYAQVFEANDPSNNTRARSMGAIALNPTGNARGDYQPFMSLAKGAKLSRHQWTELPM